MKCTENHKSIIKVFNSLSQKSTILVYTSHFKKNILVDNHYFFAPMIQKMKILLESLHWNII